MLRHPPRPLGLDPSGSGASPHRDTSQTSAVFLNPADKMLACERGGGSGRPGARQASNFYPSGESEISRIAGIVKRARGETHSKEAAAASKRADAGSP